LHSSDHILLFDANHLDENSDENSMNAVDEYGSYGEAMSGEEYYEGSEYEQENILSDDNLRDDQEDLEGWRIHSNANYDDDNSDEEVDGIRGYRGGRPLSRDGEKTRRKMEFDISEVEARERISLEALNLASDPDSIMKYYSERGTTPPDPEVLDEDRRMNRCPSVESFFRLKASIDVHFYLDSTNKMLSKDCRLDSTIYHLKRAIAKIVKVPADHLDLRRNKNLVADTRTLAELGAKPRQAMKFTVDVNRRVPGAFELTIPGIKSVVDIPDRIIKVKIPMGELKIVCLFKCCFRNAPSVSNFSLKKMGI